MSELIHSLCGSFDCEILQKVVLSFKLVRRKCIDWNNSPISKIKNIGEYYRIY